MIAPRSSTETLIAAMRILARDVKSEDGVAGSAIAEAAERLEELKQHADKMIVGLDYTLSTSDEYDDEWDNITKGIKHTMESYRELERTK